MPVLGEITWIGGPVVRAKKMKGAKIYEMVEIGNERLLGEVVQLEADTSSIQAYEETTGLKPGEPVYGTGEQFSAILGPGLIGNVYDGVQRPLSLIKNECGAFIERGIKLSPLPYNKKWHFIPSIKRGDSVGLGEILGVIKESPLIEHRIMTPPFVQGVIDEVVSEGKYDLNDTIAEIRIGKETREIKMYQKWPVRIPRPFIRKVPSNEPLITGTRIIDALFPVVKGGTVCVPGGFGSGKTVLLHTISAWADAQVVIYVGCGERGNEIVDMLEMFQESKDPRTNRPLMDRTILVANTSNMPVAAREASVHVGVTMAEYYRDMGYNVLLVADSTSRWAEALREVSGRLGELPADRGYPSYLASRIASFYERAGMVIINKKNEKKGTITICGAVSPPEGDYTEPVTSHTRRFTSVFWALDTALAYSRQYPAINPLLSSTPYAPFLEEWYDKNIGSSWITYRNEILTILQEASELKEIARLLGSETLPEPEKLILFVSRLLTNGFLHQNAFDPVDVYSSPLKQYKMLKTIIDYYNSAKEALSRDISLTSITALSLKNDFVLFKNEVANNELDEIDRTYGKMSEQFQELFNKVETGDKN